MSHDVEIFEVAFRRLERSISLLQDEMEMCLEASDGPSWPMMHLKQLNQRIEEVSNLITMMRNNSGTNVTRITNSPD